VKRKVFLFALLVVLSVASAGLVTAQEDKPDIGLVMKSLGAEFFQNMQAGAVEYAEERGDLNLIPLGTQTQEELDQQISLVENLTTQGVDAIAIAPMDSRALIPPLVTAIEQGIVVINIDVMLDEETLKEEGLSIPFVGPDKIEAARQVGSELAEELGEGGKVIIIEGIPGALNAQQRRDGFLLAIEDGGLELLSSNTANWEVEEAFSVFSDLLTAHPDVQGVMCANDAMALGVVQAIDAAGLTGQIKVVGFDNDPAIRPLVEDGRVLATIEQFGAQQAALGIDAAMRALDGEELPAWVKTPVVLITAENVNETIDPYELMAEMAAEATPEADK
jgi:ribose transport system substrate-binding protein